MSFEVGFTAAVLIIMTILLVLEWLAVEVTLFAALLALIIGNIITPEQAFAGFSNHGMLTIALLFVVAGAISNSGVLARLNPILFGRNQTRIPRKLLRILFPVAGVSSFMNNAPVVAMMIPAIRDWTEKHHLPLSKFLIPLSYAAIFGGMCTLIGTSTNLIVHGLMIDYGYDGIAMFEISKVGVPLAIFGILFIFLGGHKLLPDRKEPLIELGENTREYVIELKVLPDYANIGKTIEDAGLRHLQGLFLFQIERDSEIIAPAAPTEKIRVGDRLFFTGIPKTILELQRTPGLQLTKDSHFDLKQYDSSEIKTFECVISPDSPLVGQTVRDSNFRGVYQAVIIAIHRRGEHIRKKVGDIVLQPGDTLLLLAPKNFRDIWYHSRDFYLIAGSVEVPSKPRWQQYLSIGVLFGIIGLSAFKLVPLLAASGLGVLVLILSRSITPQEIRQIVKWRVLVIIALALGIANGFNYSGLATMTAHAIVASSGGLGSVGVLIGIYLVTSLYNLIITSNASAALLFPVAASAAKVLGADINAFAITVMIAAAASFASPISYQTNLMVYSAGGYKFTDFIRIGLPLQILVGIIALLLIYGFYF